MSDIVVVRETVGTLAFMVIIYVLGALSASPITEVSYVLIFTMFAITIYRNLTYVKRTTKTYAELMQAQDKEDEDEFASGKAPVFNTVEELFKYIDANDSESEEEDDEPDYEHKDYKEGLEDIKTRHLWRDAVVHCLWCGALESEGCDCGKTRRYKK